MAPHKSETTSRLAARYIDADLLFSDTEAWTFLRVPTVSYEFLSYTDRQSLAHRIHLALGALVTGQDPVEAHLVITTRPVSEQYWAEDLDERVQRWSPAPGWNSYRDEMVRYLEGAEFVRKEVYVGVCLGSRTGKGAPKAQALDLLAPIKALIKRGEQALDIEDDVVSADEIAYFRVKAKEAQRSLSQSHIHAVPAHENQVAWLISKALHPAMDTPAPTVSPTRVWGPGEVSALAEGEVTNASRFLKIEQYNPETGQVEVGYTATVCLSRFPDVLLFPDQEPWMHYAAALPFPVDISTRMTLVPPLKVQKDVGRKLMDAQDQATHIAETGAMVPLDLQETYEKTTALQYTISKDRVPWVYGRHRLTITAPTEEILHDRVRKVIEHYRDLAIDVVLPTGDQFDLLCESMPGGKIRAKAYFQRQELMAVAGAMPTASSEVGDNIRDGRGFIGPYIGETTSRVRTKVCFSPLVASGRNRPPGCAITGAPGGGKSFLAFTLAYQTALMGAWTIYLDPKADAIPMAQLPGLGKPQLIDLRDGHHGLLDPFALADNIPEATLLALETLRLLLSTAGGMSEDREQALTNAVDAVIGQPEPSLSKVVDFLLAQEDSASRNLGTTLRVIRELEFARLCFSPQSVTRIRPEEGLTVITLLGLDLPGADTPASEYSTPNRLAVAVMYLLTRYARRLMLSLNKDHPKAIFIDEAWAITSTPQGRKLIPEVARMGRSHNTSLTLVSQNAGDLMAESVTNNISTVFSFRSEVSEEIGNVLTLLGMEHTGAHAEAVRDLRNGECLMKDADGRLARVRIDAWNEDLFRAFDTNPETRGKSTTRPGGNPAGNGWRN